MQFRSARHGPRRFLPLPHVPGAVGALLLAWAAQAGAQPSGLAVLHGAATVQQSGSTTTITTANGAGTRHSALDWQGFQVPGGTTVFFAQPDAASTSINRVLGADPSAIL
jgi:large exoprotein involved in heme utilization and adhesion